MKAGIARLFLPIVISLLAYMPASKAAPNVAKEKLMAKAIQRRADYMKLGQAYQDRLKKAVDTKYPPATLADFVEQIDHAVKIAGMDHVGIGTDFDGGGIPGFNDDSEALNVTAEFVRRGYSEKDIKKIWGGNLLRVWQQFEKEKTHS